MSKHDPLIYFRHMLDHSLEAVSLVAGKTQSDLVSNRVLNLAVVRLLEIVGEAARRVPHEEQENHPEIAWPQIISLRNRLIHGYDVIDFDILWQVLNEDLPNLIRVLERIIPSEE